MINIESPVLNWQTMIDLEPRLLTLRHEIRKCKFTWQRYEKMKSMLRRLVGWDAEKPELKNSQAYEIALENMLAGWEGK